MNKTNKTYARDKRRESVANMYLQGKSQRVIADVLDVSLGTINGDLKYLRQLWQQNASTNIDEIISRELAKLDNLEAQAWDSYQKSLVTIEKAQGRRKSPPTKKDQPPRESESSFVKQFENAGDPRFLSIVENCIDRRCRILGIDAPGKVELTGKNGGPVEYQDKSNMAISALADMLKKNGVSLQDNEQGDEHNDQNHRV